MQCFTIHCPTAMTASPTSRGEPQIVIAHEGMGPTWEEMATFTWEKLWIWCRPIPAWPMTWPVMASRMVRVAVMWGSFTEGMELIACWGRHVDVGIVRGFL